MEIARGTTSDHEALVALWERSVRASHDFLSDDDVVALRGAVSAHALPALELWIACEDGKTVAFMGLQGNSVEALFVDPPWFGRGAGSALLDRARALRGALIVDVNEQNPRAYEFYLKYGFRQTGRSPTDSEGRPFPLIHLALDAEGNHS